MKIITKGYDIYSAMNAQIVAILFLVCALATLVYHDLLRLGTLKLPAGSKLQEVAATEGAIACLVHQGPDDSRSLTFFRTNQPAHNPYGQNSAQKGLFARVGSGLYFKTAGVEVVF